uniref:Uncharacterized protein n=1 Tax=Rhizophora mucronata TaxID=61149 RepID=A0A2P2IYB5_RHIMU
MKVFHSYSL